MPIPLVGSQEHIGRTGFQILIEFQHFLTQLPEHGCLVMPFTARCHGAELYLLIAHVDEITAIGTVLHRRTKVIELVGSTRCTESQLRLVHLIVFLIALETGTEHLVMKAGTHQVIELPIVGIHSYPKRIHFADIQ